MPVHNNMRDSRAEKTIAKLSKNLGKARVEQKWFVCFQIVAVLAVLKVKNVFMKSIALIVRQYDKLPRIIKKPLGVIWTVLATIDSVIDSLPHIVYCLLDFLSTFFVTFYLLNWVGFGQLAEVVELATYIKAEADVNLILTFATAVAIAVMVEVMIPINRAFVRRLLHRYQAGRTAAGQV